MSEWGIALIAAGSALAGSLVTGWYTRSAGMRQAEAARHAGDRQADALLDTVRLTLDEQRVARVLDLRRQTYVRFLEAAEGGPGAAADPVALQRAFTAVLLEGPTGAAQAAADLLGALRRHDRPDELDRAKRDFIAAAQAALR